MIHLSERMWAARVLGQESCGPARSAHRIAWVRIRAQPRDLIVVGVYVPHYRRKGPSQKEFFEDLRTLLLSFSAGLHVGWDWNASWIRGRAARSGIIRVLDALLTQGHRSGLFLM